MICTRQDRAIAAAEVISLRRQASTAGKRLDRAGRRGASAAELADLEDSYLELERAREIAASRL